MEHLEPGAYDLLIDSAVKQALAALDGERLHASQRPLDASVLSSYVADHIRNLLERVLRAVPEKERAHSAVLLANALIERLHEFLPDLAADLPTLPEDLQRLKAIATTDLRGNPVHVPHPATPLRETALFTNAPGEPRLGHELSSELASADAVDIVMAFVRFSGIRTLLEPLEACRRRNVPVRLVTTIYTGSTELRALQALADVGVEIKVSYETGPTRLHAKAWLFRRNSGFSTVYIGSSNLTHSAQVTGQEWNVRAGEVTVPELVWAFHRTFESYWEEPVFEPFDREEFGEHTRQQQREVTADFTHFDLRPYPFQRAMLERLAAERASGAQANLLVAATGTGKTLVAAFDYRNVRAEQPRARLLFVAHRQQILKQSRAVFRQVLKDGAFGELWVDGARPEDFEHVFASIQSLNAADLSNMPPTHFDVVIVDEFHHAKAATYEALLSHLEPKYLLGLTATPERHDGKSVLDWFGGRIAVELRLWDALEQQLLAPFHYFGVNDGTDLREVRWQRGRGYDTGELEQLYTADDVWLRAVLGAVKRYVSDANEMRAIGFCVSKDHARFMARRFSDAGLPAVAVTADSSTTERDRALSDLQRGAVRVVFTVDLYNEGVDIPAVDVLLMLRPTESATIFIQQLGRGLRRSDDKDVLTVLDFVGNHRAEFRFDEKLARLTGRTRPQLIDDVPQDFPFLPPGCAIHFEREAQETVLRSLKKAIPTTLAPMTNHLRELGDISLLAFLEHTGLDLPTLYANPRSMTELRARAGHCEALAAGSIQEKIARGVGRLLHMRDADRLDLLARLVGEAPFDVSALDKGRLRILQGILLSLVGASRKTALTTPALVDALRSSEHLRRELAELVEALRRGGGNAALVNEEARFEALRVHGHYTREEVLAAIGASTVEAPMPLQTGVYWAQELGVDLLFVTLEKNEADFSPTTRYSDYALTERRFHWESQGVTRASSPTGQRYIHHAARGSHVWLFIRTAKKNSYGRTMPYAFAGPAEYVAHESERPMQIIWQLQHPLPAELFMAYRAAVA